jgi:murein DD-endopeptidase MepM/ murein hydrolase activator NlpD
MGGVFNLVNLHLYHYAGNNPVKYTDPDGRANVEGTTTSGKTYFDKTTKSLREASPKPIWPTESHRVTWKFGADHKLGIDIGALEAGVAGDTVRASMGGTVTTSGKPTWSPSGSSYVIINGTDGREYRYVHMDGLKVKQSDQVAQGQELGSMDKVGAPGGVHLHFEIRENGKAVDPLKLLPSD